MNVGSVLGRRVGAAVLTAVAVLASPVALSAQRGAGPAPTPRTAAPIDLAGYWVSMIVDEWRFRVTPQKGDILYLPINAEARRVTGDWDPARDDAEGSQCRAYGAVGVMQRPGRLHITWEEDSTLRIETDAGTQTRLLRFGSAPADLGPPSWQGYSAAEWELPGGGRGRRGAPPPTAARTGAVKVVTRNLRPGYIRKNGVPHSGSAVLTEHLALLTGQQNDTYLLLTAIVEDAAYLTQPFIRSYTFKKVPDATGWDPTPCWPR